MKISKAFGIDLGTTRSLIGVMDVEDRNIILWRNEIGKATVPSVIQWDREANSYKVGEDAVINRFKTPYPIRSIKRSMGMNIQIDHGGKKLSPEEISAEILKHLKECGKELIQTSLQRRNDGNEYMIDRAVVTIPAYFDAPKIEATRKAAEMAGIKTLQLLHEPTAAALYYCWRHNISRGNFLVYDLGGGTFDVSIIQRVEGSFKVLGIAGDNVLGGDTFDMALADYIISELCKVNYNLKLDVQKDPKDKLIFDYFTQRAEGIKQRLSTEDVVLFSDTSCPETDKNGKSIYVELRITRRQFEAIITDHVDRTIDKCFEAIEKATEKAKGTFNGIKDIDHILLVGGSTWTPYIRNTVQNRLCRREGEPERARAENVLQDEPDECVAMGASLLASSDGGIQFLDEANDILLHLEGSSISSDEEMKIKGKVTHLDSGKGNQDLMGYMVTLTKNGDEIANAGLGEHGEFYFDEVYLEENIPSNLAIIIRNQKGEEIGRYSRSVGQGADIGGEVNAVNSHPIWIPVLSAKGERVKEILVDSGASLPAQREIELVTTQETSVLFNLFQGNKEIKQFIHNFEQSQTKGTKIHLSMNIDGQGNIIMRSIIEGLDPFIMETKSLPPDPPVTPEELKIKRKEFDAIKEEMSPAQKMTAEIKVKKLSKEISECIQRGDDPRARELMDEFNMMMEDIKPMNKKLVPPKDEFLKKVGELRQLIHENKDAFPKYDDLIKNVEAQEQEGSKAYKNFDQQALTDCMIAIKSLEEYINITIPPPPPPPWASAVPIWAKQLITMLTEMISLSNNETLNSEARQSIQELKSIPDFFPSDEEAKVHFDKLHRAYKIYDLMKEKLGIASENSAINLPGLINHPSQPTGDRGGF